MDWMQLLAQLAAGLGGNPGATGGPGVPGSTPGQTIGSNVSPILQRVMALISSYGAGQYGTQELQNLQQLFQQQQRAAGIAFNPAAMAARTVAGTVPINKELAYTVGQAADANTASNGMFQSPGAVASGRAAALAPYAEQNLQMGQQNAQVGLPYQFATQSPDFLSVLKELQQYGSGSTFSLPAGAPGMTP